MLTLLTYQPVGNLNRHSLYSIMFMRQERVALLLLAGVAVTVLAARLVISPPVNSRLPTRSRVLLRTGNW